MAGHGAGGVIEGLAVIIFVLFVTIFIELIVSLFLKYGRRERWVVFLINTMINPLAIIVFAVVATLFSQIFDPPIYSIIILFIAIEAAVIVAEWKLLVYALKIESKTALRHSLAMNLTSAIIGLPLIFFILVSGLFFPGFIVLVISIILLIVLAKKSDAVTNAKV